MKAKYLLVVATLGVAMASSAAAQNSEIGYPKGSLAYEALMAADYGKAEKQLRSDNRVLFNDPAKLINYGLVMVGTGRLKEARNSFEQVLHEEEIELIMADGRAMGSHDVARQGLEMVKSAHPAVQR